MDQDESHVFQNPSTMALDDDFHFGHGDVSVRFKAGGRSET